jgi:hypothetical protein
MKYYTIYKTVNKINGKIYIGKHQCEDPFDDYIGSGILLQNAINKHGINNFEKTVLYIFDNEKEMNDKEIDIVNEEFVLREDTYNIALGGQGGKLIPFKYKLNLSEDERNRRSKQSINIHTGSKRSIETKEKMKISQTGKTKSDITKKKTSESLIGKTKSDITKKKLSESIKKSLPTYICDVCGKEGKGNTMKLYHFENCKNMLS